MSKQLTTTSEEVSAHVVIASIEKKAGKYLKILSSTLEIKTKEQYENSAIYLKELKACKKEAEVKEATITTPLKKALDATKALFKPFYTKVDVTEQLTKKAMLTFISEQEDKIKKLEAKFEKGEIKKVNTLLNKTAEHTITSGTASVRTTKEVVIVDEAQIPREYMMPDLSKIKAAFKNGIVVKGCKIEDKKGLAI